MISVHANVNNAMFNAQLASCLTTRHAEDSLIEFNRVSLKLNCQTNSYFRDLMIIRQLHGSL